VPGHYHNSYPEHSCFAGLQGPANESLLKLVKC
jgi:hypothetical protein